MTIVEWLRERQVEAGIGDRAFAEMLGIDLTYWFKLRKGQKRVTTAREEALVTRALRLYPDHCADLKTRFLDSAA